MMEKIKALLGIVGNESDDVLQIMIDDAKCAVRLYCNRVDYPDPLDWIVRELVIDSFHLNNDGDVSSITRGDTSISYNQTITKHDFSEKQKNAMFKFKKIRFD